MKKVMASMAGTVIQVLVSAGDQISMNQEVVVLESMKMEVPISAEHGGTVMEIKVQVGDFVNEGDVILLCQ